MENIRELFCCSPNRRISLAKAIPGAAANQKEGFLPTDIQGTAPAAAALSPHGLRLARGEAPRAECRGGGVWIPALLCSSDPVTLGALIQPSEPISIWKMEITVSSGSCGYRVMVWTPGARKSPPEWLSLCCHRVSVLERTSEAVESSGLKILLSCAASCGHLCRPE